MEKPTTDEKKHTWARKGTYGRALGHDTLSLSDHHSLFSVHRRIVHEYPLRSWVFSVASRLFLSIHMFTWQSRANASLIHSIHANTFTPSRERWPLHFKPRHLKMVFSSARPTPFTPGPILQLTAPAVYEFRVLRAQDFLRAAGAVNGRKGSTSQHWRSIKFSQFPRTWVCYSLGLSSHWASQML